MAAADTKGEVMGITGVYKTKLTVRKAIEFAIEDVVKTTVAILTAKSPIWAGEYIKSHVAEESAKQYPRDNTLLPPEMLKKPVNPMQDYAIRIEVKDKLKKSASNIALKTGKVSINNTAKHAVMVEHHKYQNKFGSIVHKPFGKTEAAVTLRKKSIIDNAKHRAFKK